MKNSNIYRDKLRRNRRRWTLLVAGVVFACLTSAASALDPSHSFSQYIHDTWGADKGFVGGNIYAISQSDDGYLWIGTERGLVRFDGSNFMLIQRILPESAPIGPVRGLVSDAYGNLWIRLDGSRLLVYRDGKFADTDSRLELQGVPFSAIASDNNGGVLLSAVGDRTVRLRSEQVEAVLRSDRSPGTVISLTTTRDGKIWLGTQDNGLFRVSGGNVTWVPTKLQERKINTLLPAKNGGLWIGTDQGIRFWDGSRLVDFNLPSSTAGLKILTMVMDQDGNVWVGTNHGIIRITASQAVSFDEWSANGGDEVTAMFQDHDGDLWVGSSRGIERIRDGTFTTYGRSQGLPSNKIGPIYVDTDGRTWFAPISGGLYWMNEGIVHRVTVGEFDRDVVYSIDGGNDEIWVGRQRGGLTLLTHRGDALVARTFTHSDGLAQNSVFTVHRCRDGTVWAGTISAGVSEYRSGKFTNYSEADGLMSNTVNSITQGHDGTVWLATANGLNSYLNGHWKRYSAADGLPSPNVRTVFEDNQNLLWVVTSGGLSYVQSGQIKSPTKLPEELREQILGVEEDRMNSLWFATSDHVLRVNKDRLLDGSLVDTDIQIYGIRDGLQGIEGVARDRSVVSDSRDRVWISLNSGISMADPKVTAYSAIPVKVRIESVLAAGRSMDRQNLAFPSDTQSMTFNYAGTNLAQPERIRFRYKLDNSDSGWSDIVDSRQVVYSNPGPGTYRFRVVASNSDGLWNGPETSVPLVIEPALWQTLWFRAACVAMCLLLLLSFYRLRMHQLAKQLNLRFQDRLAERTLVAQELHDTLLQGVLSARLQLDVAEDQLPLNSPAKPLVRRVLQLMATVTEEGRNALRGLRAPETDHSSLESAFARMRKEFALDDRIDFRVIVDSDTRPLRPLIRDEVYRIGREALFNAFVHAKAKNIEVEVEYGIRQLRVQVRDDGIGIDPEVLDSGRDGHWGLSGMRERSESIGARLRLRSRIGAGTEVELSVPSTIAFEQGTRGYVSRWPRWPRRNGNGKPNKDQTKQEHT